MTVKIIEEKLIVDLRIATETYLDDINHNDIVSISYSGIGYKFPFGKRCYSVMVVTK